MVELASIAATEIQNVREKFKSFAKILNHIKENDTRAGWPGFDAAVACGLAGDATTARQYFDKVAAWETNASPWRTRAKMDTAALVALLEHPQEFRAAVSEYVAQRRQLMRLPPDPHCFDELDSKAKP